MANSNLSAAKKAKNDEFYTQYSDIEKEMNAYLEYNEDAFRGGVLLLPCDDPEWSNFTKYFVQNFKRLGLKKLISTSYAPNSKPYVTDYQPGLFELESPNYDPQKNPAHGKVFTLEHDITGDGEINLSDLEWKYLEGDGDFRSEEVKKLCDEATHIVTNPPFSLFREFLAWIVKDKKKKFSIVGNVNATTYKEVFPIIKENKMWWGASPRSMTFATPEQVDKDVNSVWFTNMDHGRRHAPLSLMTTADNIKFSKHENVKSVGYTTYDNYNAIEVPFIDAIPSDHKGVMGVPITFLSKYNPDQFEILGSRRWAKSPELIKVYTGEKTAETDFKTLIAGRETYDRIFIKHKSKKEQK